MDSREISLDHLRLDERNPRFGLVDGSRVSQTEILDFIVNTFGVDDVLSSIAVNGYFNAEPLVCRSAENGEFVVMEGNRRLAACLILAGKEAAKNHGNLTTSYQKTHADHGGKDFNPVPCIVVEADADPKSILSYLGVRHISAAQQWDSFAKAVWIDRVVNEAGLTTSDVAEMIGDKHRTVSRLLEGFNFIKQLQREGKFLPENSQRKGRGSNTSYPFSWVYTILGYSSVRDFLNIPTEASETDLIPGNKIEDAALITRAMFGDRSRGLSAAVEDSRELGSLASAVTDPAKIEMLRSGKKIKEIEVLTQPLEKRLAAGLILARDTLGDINNRLTEESLAPETAKLHIEQSTRVSKLAAEVERKVREASKIT
jgi:ParB-like chromosome segregation protein Spo0J